MRKRWPWIVAVVMATIIAAQAIRPDLTVKRAEPTNSFDRVLSVPPDTARLLFTACGDCHSDRTVWPWYSQITPVNWWTASHVHEARGNLDLSDWRYSDDDTRDKLAAIADEMDSNGMPPGYYALMHGSIALTTAEQGQISAWAKAELDKRGGPLPRDRQ